MRESCGGAAGDECDIRGEVRGKGVRYALTGLVAAEDVDGGPVL